MYSTSCKMLNLVRKKDFNHITAEYLSMPPSRSELVKIIHIDDVDVLTAVRKHEPFDAELNLATATDEQLLDSMAEHNTRFKRLFVVTPKGARQAKPIDAVHEIR
ncbi:arsenate reductase [Mycobacterium leprae Kyoto-2]|uniref:Arsenate reductase n=3 Tax=Mycobacterium leprae TaxID=1769 RepID=Q9CD46_MYCLE|nr:arsenate reductase family protein [Mycobacterium leprae]CAR70340.1 putative arsenate reductase [Mycobacterium leprae Br4923]AWV47217.1 arsenate reductase [Mycobacterium leprae]OAR21395.1 ArsC family transcriptional regulator [Mycobacterium leprae 3125609]OAX71594.1 ArsC family transcriptional regulator [Mycobacterium leprae 7935681]CAC29755.1 putative arsenate reductase [Mycobacterium leprae]